MWRMKFHMDFVGFGDVRTMGRYWMISHCRAIPFLLVGKKGNDIVLTAAL